MNEIQLDNIGNNDANTVLNKQLINNDLYRVFESIVAATYLITKKVPYRESLRETIRNMSTALLSDIMTFSIEKKEAQETEKQKEKIASQARLILSFFDTLYIAGEVSEMNLKMLKEAYRNFAAHLEAISPTDIEQEHIDQLLVHIPIEKSNLKGSRNTSKAVTRNNAITHNKRKASQASGVQGKSIPKTQRADTILSFLRANPLASAGDISQIISGCSTKTIQRDLINMVSQGVLQKQGTKRWTRYSVVS